jgi:hypothetical protein
MAPSSPLRSPRARLGVLTASLAVAAASTLAGGTSPAVSAVGDACPEAFPVEEVAADQAVTGLTVDSGLTPEEFQGTVLGVLEDGIAPGLDMIMVRLNSAEIDRVGGIWAGMSGSPVYAEDGRLLGAVAYGFAGTTPVAGVTPAAAMRDLLGGGALGRAADTEVAVPRRLERELVASGDVTARQVDGGLVRLPTPVAVSGLQGARQMNKAAKRLGIDDTRFFRAGSASPVVVTPEEAGIEPGGSLGVSMSYGDFSTVGLGTVTMVCGEEVVGFGHPMNWSGPSTMTMHGASTIYVQEDPTWVPFKVANPTGPVGTIDNDRLAGVAGFTGTLPDTTSVTSSATSSDTGFARTGTTFVSMQEFLADLAALGVVVNNTRVIDKVGEGSADIRFTLTGAADGQPFTLTRGNRVSSDWDIGYMSPEELYYTISLLQSTRLADVEIDEIMMRSSLTEANLAYRIGAVQVREGGSWRTLTRNESASATAGRTLRLRVDLAPNAASVGELDRQRRIVRVPVPRSLAGQEVEMGVSGGEVYLSNRSVRAASFPELVTRIEDRPRTDQVAAQLFGPRRLGELPSVTSRKVGQVIEGGRSFTVVIG